MRHLVFPTYELYPANSGGAGVFIAGAVQSLARAGHRVTVLCHFPDPEVTQANAHLATLDLGPGAVKAVSVDSLMWGRAPDPYHFESHYELNSERFAMALARLAQLDPFDYVEFPEYAGIGYATLRKRLEEHQFPGVLFGVRIHGSLELIDQAEGVPAVEPARLRMYRLERLALKLADVVLGPSQTICRQYAWAHGLDADRLVVSPPPMEVLLADLKRAERRVDPAHFLLYGKLQEVKGCDTFIQAGVALLLGEPDVPWRFTIVGRDTFCTRHQQMASACMDELLPSELKPSFEFLPGIPRASLPELATRPIAAVVPSRFESFCLAAHELRAVGLPLIVPPLPAFADWLTPQSGCLQYDGTANGLSQAMLTLWQSRATAAALEACPPPHYPKYAEAYVGALERPVAQLRTEQDWVMRSEFRALDDMRTGKVAPPTPLGAATSAVKTLVKSTIRQLPGARLLRRD